LESERKGFGAARWGRLLPAGGAMGTGGTDRPTGYIGRRTALSPRQVGCINFSFNSYQFFRLSTPFGINFSFTSYQFFRPVLHSVPY
jgi:hypothetical protein